MLDVLGYIADITGILSFIISAILWWNFDRMKKELKSQYKDYRKEQKDIQTKLLALRDSLCLDGLTDLKTRSNLRIELHKYKINYNNIIGITAKGNMDKLIKMLESENINIEEACKYIDFLIARFDKKEVAQ